MPKVVDHQERRIKLIEATWRTIVRDGWDATTMSAIATGAGFATGPARVPHHQGGPAVGRLRPHLTRPAALRSCCLEILPLDATSRDEAVWSSRSGRKHSPTPASPNATNGPRVSGEQRSSTSSPRRAKQARSIPTCATSRSSVTFSPLSSGSQITASLLPSLETTQTPLTQLDGYLDSLNPPF